MEFQPQDKIVLSEKQLHGNAAILLDGEVISIEGSRACVAIDGEVVPRMVPIDSLSKASAMYGDDPSGRPNEMPVFNAIRS